MSVGDPVIGDEVAIIYGGLLSRRMETRRKGKARRKTHGESQDPN